MDLAALFFALFIAIVIIVGYRYESRRIARDEQRERARRRRPRAPADDD